MRPVSCSKPCTAPPEITLNADQSMFSIEFATSNYVAANKDDIIYKLEGFSNDWNSARGLHNITYTNLNAGTYNLIIKPNGKDESLCPQVHLTIHVLPPYYKTPPCLSYLPDSDGNPALVSGAYLQVQNQVA